MQDRETLKNEVYKNIDTSIRGVYDMLDRILDAMPIMVLKRFVKHLKGV